MSANAHLKLFRATEADVAFVMATERLHGYENLVGRWDEARHLSALSDGRHAYFVAQADATPIGFGIVRDFASPEQVAAVQRVAVVQPGRGYGKALLRALVGAVFGETETYRLWLGVFPDNRRARRAYEAIGFIAEGVARGSAFFGGRNRDELIMSILRPEWLARHPVERD